MGTYEPRVQGYDEAIASSVRGLWCLAMDIDALRADTPGCFDVVHFNNAGTSLPPRPVIDAQISWINQEAHTGGYEMAEDLQEQVAGVYGSLARLIGADPSEIALMENATVAWWQAFHSLDLQGKTVLTSEVDYGANFISYLQAARRDDVETVVVPSDESGQISLEELEKRLDERVGLLAVSHMPTNGGLVNPAAEIGAMAREAGVPFLLDACQTVGQMPIDVDAIGCSFLSATGRKYLRGPRGTGFLYARSSFLEANEPLMLDHFGASWVEPERYVLRPDARRYETWESNHAIKAGLGVAAEYAMSVGLESIAGRVFALAAGLRDKLTGIGATTYDLGRVKGGIVTFSVPGVDAAAVKRELRAQSINTSLVDPASTLIDAKRRHLPEMVRASVHYYNTSGEIDTLIAALEPWSTRSRDG
ncbi:putative cysteine desulfurase [bacterium BMS3Bbin01]|nr:putative cysteine desulfurase [bacterium BMS3Bbin01]